MRFNLDARRTGGALALVACPALAAAQTTSGPTSAAVAAVAPASAPVALSAALSRELASLVNDSSAARRGAFLSRMLSSRALSHDSTRIDALLTQLHDAGAPYVLVDSGAVGRHRFAKLQSRRAPRVVTVDLATDRAEPTRLGDIDVLESHAAVLDSIAWPATRPVKDADAIANIDRTVQRLARGGGFSGTVYVTRGDSVLLARGYGFANLEDSIPNGVHTRFALASMGKMFTATAVLQLVEQGKLRLTDTLERVLPAYPNHERASRITIAELLQHTAGLGDMWSTPRKPVAGLTGALADAAAVAYPPLAFEPGTRWSYSNEGFIVLAAVIERVSGEPYLQYIQRHVFAVARMTETSVKTGADYVIPHRAVGYRPAADDPLGAGALRGNWTFLGQSAGGAGGGYSTVGDIARFGRALREGKLIGAALRDSMWTGRWDLPGYEGQRYGFASFVMPVGSRIAVGHGGGGTGSGMDNGFKQFTDGSYQVVVLANWEPPAGGRLADAIIRYLGAEPDRGRR
ncbi:MAG TPA: serine hydrolase domain-containing protein [Gemmatimonadaceae bacterium]|nr:serine hydrolase domain-containing protein [Gemmatimonadaceae bacterium]